MRLIITKLPLSMTLILLTGAIISSCVGAVEMFPTITPTPGKTIEPTSTPSLMPSSTPTSTATPEVTPTNTPEPTQVLGPVATARLPLQLGTLKTIPEAGFSFRTIIGYEERYQPGQVTLTSDDGATVLSLIGGQADSSEDLHGVLVSFTEILSKSVNFVEFNTGAPYSKLIDGNVGLAAEVDGLWGENPIAGRIIVVSPSEGVAFYALAFSSSNPDGEGWNPRGRQAFEAVIRSVNFLGLVDSQ